MWSAIGQIGAGLLGGLFGHNAAKQQTAYNREAAEADRAFQREVFQNQIQWKAQDAKKAGLHPLAALGGGAYTASSVSTPGVAPDYSGPAAQMAKGIGDAFAAYKNKDELAAEQAIAELRAAEMHNSQKDLLDAQSAYYKSMAQEATTRSLSYTRPLATGREYMPGQVDSPSPMLQKFVKPDGTLTGWKPGNDYQEVHSDIPILEFKPHVEAAYWNLRDMFKRQPSRSPNYYYPRSYR